MTDREFAVTGVPGELDLEEEVTGVPSTSPISDVITEPEPSPFQTTIAPYAPPVRPTPLGPAPSTPLTTSDFQMIQASLYLMDPSLIGDEDRTAKFVNRFAEAYYDGSPELLTMLSIDPQRALGLANEQYLEQTMVTAAGDETPPQEALYRAMHETYARQYGQVLTAGQLLNDAEVLRGAWEATSLNVTPAAVGNFGIEVNGSTVEGIEALPIEQVRALEEIEGRGVVWATQGADLALAVSEATDGPTFRALIRLDPNTTIADHADVVRAYIMARSGLAHTIDEDSDELPGPQTVWGAITEQAGDLLRWTEDHGARPAYEVVTNEIMRQAFGITNTEQILDAQAAGREQQYLDSLAGAHKAAASDEAIIAAVATQFIGEGSSQGNALVMAMDAWAALPEADKVTLKESLLGELDSEEALRKFRELEDDRTVLGTLVEDIALPRAMAIFEAWDRVAHGIGVFFLDATAGIAEAVTGDGPINPVTIVTNAVGEALDNKTVSQFYDMDPESAAAQWVDIGGSIIFDPLTWATPGGKAGWRALTRAMNDPALAQQWVYGRNELRSLARNLVDGSNPQMVELFGTGLSPDALVRLWQIGGDEFTDLAARKAATKEVLDTLVANTPANGGFWVPTGPAAIPLRQGVQGLSKFLANMDIADNAAVEKVATMLTKSSTHRAIRTDDAFFLDDAIRLVTTRFPTQADKFRGVMDELVNVWKAFRGDSADLVAAVTARSESVSRATRAVRQAADATQVPMLRKEQAALRQAIFRQQALAGTADFDQAVVDQLTKAKQSIDDLLAEGETTFERLALDEAALRREALSLKHELDFAQSAGDRNLLRNWVDSFMDDWADDLGIPVLENGRRAWDLVSDFARTGVGQERPFLNLAPFGEDATDAARAGLGAAAREAVLPVSPMELVAYGALGGDKFSAVRSVLKNQAVQKTLNNMQYVFSASVLLNAVTPFKAHLDEVLRFYSSTGQIGRSLAATGSFIGRRGGSSAGTQYGREMGNLVALRDSAWDVVTNPRGTRGALSREFFEAAERWVNGTLVQSPTLQAYARALATEADEASAVAAFAQWFEESGRQTLRRIRPNGDEVDARFVWDTIQNSLGVLRADAVRNGDELVEAILKAAANNEQITNHGLINAIGRVPAQVQSRDSVFGKLFNVMFGGPGARRGAVFFDHYRESYMAMHANRADLLDEAALLRGGFAESPEAARAMIAAGRTSPDVQSVLSAQNLVLRSDLEDAATRWAAQRADDLMFSVAASSVFGRRSTRLWPFGRATIDFVDYWFRQLSAPTQIRFGRTVKDVPGVPLNLRILSRMSKVTTLDDDPETFGDQPRTPTWLANTFTFFPTSLDEQMVINNVPSLGPLPTWLINWLPEDDPRRRAVEVINPAGDVFADYTNDDVMSGFSHLVDALLPTSGRSIRSNAAAMAAYVAAISGQFEPTEVSRIFNAIVAESEPPFLRDNLALLEAEWFAETSSLGVPNAFAFNPSIQGESIPVAALEVMMEEAMRSGYQRNILNQLQRNIGGPTQYGSDAQYATLYAGVRDVIDAWEEAGWVTPGLADDFRLTALEVAPALDDDERVDPSKLNAFADVASDIINLPGIPDLEKAKLFIDHPELLANLASSWEVVPELVPDEWAHAVSGTRVVAPFGPARDEVFAAGRDGGWVVLRDNSDVFFDRHARAARFAADYIRGVWEEAVPIPWSKGRLNQTEAGSVVTIPADWEHFDRLARIGVNFPDVWRNEDGSVTTTLGELREHLGAQQDRFDLDVSLPTAVAAKLSNLSAPASSQAIADAAEAHGWTGIEWTPQSDVNFYGPGLVEDIQEQNRLAKKLFGWDNPSEWENVTLDNGAEFNADEVKEWFRQRFRVSVLLNPNFTVGDYNRHFARDYGDLNWEAPEPPPVAELSNAVTTEDANEISVIDGDTLVAHAADGTPLYFRLLGLNAPEQGQAGYGEASITLRRLLDQAGTITIGQFQPELFGTTQEFRTQDAGIVVDRERVFAWLYVDGVPIYDPSVFTATNPRGTPGVESEVPDYFGYLNAQVEGEVS
ncbi:MAG: hypothetical protein DWQ40_00430 [Actinobacteria bacterium]|nr:MAG: hypothetical protein DWQ40_00430 [Actinomycetota bacterium]REK34110.1 MAG: hypothetical protein DWQ20_07065 [Actinomycetota bacterium]